MFIPYSPIFSHEYPLFVYIVPSSNSAEAQAFLLRNRQGVNRWPMEPLKLLGKTWEKGGEMIK
jgi:hypothetical protein